MCVSFACMSFCAPPAYMVPGEARRGYWSLHNWNYYCLWTIMWVLGIEPWSFGESVRTLNYWAVSLPPTLEIWVALNTNVWFVFHPLVPVISTRRRREGEREGVREGERREEKRREQRMLHCVLKNSVLEQQFLLLYNSGSHRLNFGAKDFVI